MNVPPADAPLSALAARRIARLATVRLARELRTIAAMMRIWCRDHHGAAERNAPQLCAECALLLEYARQRLANCPFGPEKPTCTKCPIHCYGKRQRAAVKDVMRYAGPRMLLRHPWLAIAHVFDGRRRVPPRPGAGRAAESAAAPASAGAQAPPDPGSVESGGSSAVPQPARLATRARRS
jgi:hypothetical protein